MAVATEDAVRHQTRPSEHALAEVLRTNAIDVVKGPTPDQVDAIIADYDTTKRVAAEYSADEKEAKKTLLTLIRIFGHPAPESEHSHVIQGALHTAMMTNVTTTSLDEDRVAALSTFLHENGRYELFARLFATRIKHELVSGAEIALQTANLPAWMSKKVKAMFGECIKVADQAPRVKITMLAKEPKQPRKRAAKKAAHA